MVPVLAIEINAEHTDLHEHSVSVKLTECIRQHHD